MVSSADADPSGWSALAQADDYFDNKPRCFAPTSNHFRDRLRRPLYQPFPVRDARRDLSADDERSRYELFGDRLARQRLHSGHFGTATTGGVMTRYGFRPAFSVISISYLLAMSLLMLLRVPHKDGVSVTP